MNNKIEHISKQYRNHRDGNIRELYNHYIAKRKSAIVDSIASATAVGTIFLSDQVDYDAITPQMEEAFALAFPRMELSDLENYSADQLPGLISAWKGKTFEVEVAERLNNGELVGDIQLEPGQYAELADTATQPGWDLQIFNADGSVAEALQLKATESIGYITQTLTNYPDIEILTTAELAELHPELINSGISNDDLTDQVSGVFNDILDSQAEDLLEAFFPGIGPLIILGTEGRKMRLGKQSWETTKKNVAERGVASVVSTGAGATVAILVSGGLAVPVAFAANYGIRNFQDKKKATKLFDDHLNDIKSLKVRYGR